MAPNGSHASVPTLSLIEEYQTHRQALVDRGRLSHRSVHDHRYSLETFAGVVPSFPWTRTQLRAFVDHFPRELSGTRVHTICAHVRSFQSWLELDRFDGVEPPIRFPSWQGIAPGNTNKPPVPLAPTQADALIEAATRDPLVQAMIVLFRETGIRPFELRDLRWEDLEPTGWTTKGRGRTKRAHYVPIARELYDLLKAVSPTVQTGGYVFPGRTSTRGKIMPGQPMGERSTNPMVKRYFREAGITADHEGPYMLRHTFIMAMKETVGVELTSILVGHADIAKAAGLSKMTTHVYGQHAEMYVREQYLEARDKLGWRVPTAPRQGSMDEALAVAS